MTEEKRQPRTRVQPSSLTTVSTETASTSARPLTFTGSSAVRAGWSFEEKPRLNIPPIMSKYRDRKAGKTYSFAGSDCYADTTARSHIRYAFEQGTGIVSNWDVMEHLLDYIFLKLGLNGDDASIDVPIVMTEAVANLPYSRKCKPSNQSRDYTSNASQP